MVRVDAYDVEGYDQNKLVRSKYTDKGQANFCPLT